MAGILEQMQIDMLEAMKAKDGLKSEILKLVVAAIKTEKIDNPDKTDEVRVIQIVRSNIKAMAEAAEQYTAVGSKENAQKELDQIKVLEAYLPAQMGDEDIQKAVADVISQMGVVGIQDMGKVMGLVMQKLSGQADGAKVQEIVKSTLSQ